MAEFDGISWIEGIVIAALTLIQTVIVAILNRRQSLEKAEIDTEANLMRERTNTIIKSYELINEQIDRARAQLEEAEEIKKLLRNELENTIDLKENLERRVATLQDRVDTLEHRLFTGEEEKAKLIARINVYEQRIREYEGRIERYEQREEQMAIKVRDLERQLAKYTNGRDNINN